MAAAAAPDSKDLVCSYCQKNPAIKECQFCDKTVCASCYSIANEESFLSFDACYHCRDEQLAEGITRSVAAAADAGKTPTSTRYYLLLLRVCNDETGESVKYGIHKLIAPMMSTVDGGDPSTFVSRRGFKEIDWKDQMARIDEARPLTGPNGDNPTLAKALAKMSFEHDVRQWSFDSENQRDMAMDVFRYTSQPYEQYNDDASVHAIFVRAFAYDRMGSTVVTDENATNKRKRL